GVVGAGTGEETAGVAQVSEAARQAAGGTGRPGAGFGCGNRGAKVVHGVAEAAVPRFVPLHRRLGLRGSGGRPAEMALACGGFLLCLAVAVVRVGPDRLPPPPPAGARGGAAGEEGSVGAG